MLIESVFLALLSFSVSRKNFKVNSTDQEEKQKQSLLKPQNIKLYSSSLQISDSFDRIIKNIILKFNDVYHDVGVDEATSSK